MRRSRLVMNMTSMLDILIILFFAQAIEFKDKTDQKISECEQSADALQEKYVGMEAQVTFLKKNNEKLTDSNLQLAADIEKLNNSNAMLSENNKKLHSDLSQKANELADISEQYNHVKNELDHKDKELKKIKNDIHLVGENIEPDPIIENILQKNTDNSKGKTAEKIIEFINTQRDIQKQTEKKVAIWIVTLDNFYDKRDKKEHLILRLFISGKENKKFKELSEKQPWDWGNSDEIHPEELKAQLLAAFNRIDVISDSDIQLVNIVLCFKDKSDTILTPQIKVFNKVYEDLFYQLEKIYSEAPSVDNPKGRGKGVIRLIPIPFDPEELHPLDPDMLIK